MQKIVINKCYGGFSLSPLAVERLAELNGEKCYFFKFGFTGGEDEYTPISVEDADKTMMWVAFSVKNPSMVLPKANRGAGGTFKDFNKKYENFSLTSRPENRTDHLLIKVVEELGELANGMCAKLKIIEIPDSANWEIDEYDGMETVHEKHESWG